MADFERFTAGLIDRWTSTTPSAQSVAAMDAVSADASDEDIAAAATAIAPAHLAEAIRDLKRRNHVLARAWRDSQRKAGGN